MAIQQVQVAVDSLVLGMYISRLDRAWSQTPFSLQGFYLRSPGEISQLQACCNHVFIDIQKGRAPLDTVASPVTSSQKKKIQYQPLSRSTARIAAKAVKKNKEQTASTPIIVRKGFYETRTALRKEAVQAKKIVGRLKGTLTLVVKQMGRGRAVDYGRL